MIRGNPDPVGAKPFRPALQGLGWGAVPRVEPAVSHHCVINQLRLAGSPPMPCDEVPWMCLGCDEPEGPECCEEGLALSVLAVVDSKEPPRPGPSHGNDQVWEQVVKCFDARNNLCLLCCRTQVIDDSPNRHGLVAGESSSSVATLSEDSIVGNALSSALDNSFRLTRCEPRRRGAPRPNSSPHRGRRAIRTRPADEVPGTFDGRPAWFLLKGGSRSNASA